MRALQHPVLRLSGPKRLLIFLGALVLTFVEWYALQTLDVPLETPQARWGIISLELSHTVERSQEILDSWNLAARDNAQSGLLLDFLFPACYSTVTTIACFWAAALFHERGFRKTRWLTVIIAWLQWPAAAFDYVENIALWVQLRGTVADPWPRIASTCALIKFLLIAAGLGVLIAAAAVWVLRRRATPAVPST